jgi:hypothetical protein
MRPRASCPTYNGRPLGTIGHLGALSFHETKNIISGEGGALLVNDMALAERAEIIREKGTNRARFFRGQVDKYTWVDVGSSYLPSELVAAFLWAQMEEAEVDHAQATGHMELLPPVACRYRTDKGAAPAARSCRRTAPTMLTCTTCYCPAWRSAASSSRN